MRVDEKRREQTKENNKIKKLKRYYVLVELIRV